MALSDFFLTPLGLGALASVVPLIILYLIKPDPRNLEIPTFRFLAEDAGEGGRNPVIQTLRRNLLLLIQLLVLILLTLALATPYVAVSERVAADATVLVVDASASMATQVGGGTRFSRAVSAAGEETTGTTSVVVSGIGTRLALEEGSASEAERVLSSLGVTDATGDLRAAISQATTVASEESRILVFSDFSDASGWRTALQAARAEGYDVELRQFAGGGTDNVGVVDLSFRGNRVTASIANLGTSAADRQVRFGGETRSLSLQPGDVVSESFPVPAGGGELTLTPGDSFPVDDTAYVAAPDESTVDVLLVTNDENRFLSSALSVVGVVDLTVKNPPVAISQEYDVMVFSNVAPDRVLDSTLEAARDTVSNGGGVAIQAQEDMGAVGYGDLLLIQPDGLGSSPVVRVVGADPLVEGFDFPPPEEFVVGRLSRGRALVNVSSANATATPLIATARDGPGRILYYGYVEDTSDFKFNYRYPVFWKRSVFYLAGRQPLPALNMRTGERLQLPNGTQVDSPTGTRTASTLVLDVAGFYSTGDGRVGANLLSRAESNVTAPSINGSGGGSSPGATGTREERVPMELTPYVALLAIALGLVELGYMRYRGDI